MFATLMTSLCYDKNKYHIVSVDESGPSSEQMFEVTHLCCKLRYRLTVRNYIHV